MLQRGTKTFFALWLAIFSAPGFAWSCAMPCTMDQGQMLACVKACSLAKDPSSGSTIGKAACTRLDLSAAPVLLAPGEVLAPVPAHGFASPSSILPSLSAPQQSSAAFQRGPPSSPQSQASLSLPTTHAPPALN